MTAFIRPPRATGIARAFAAFAAFASLVAFGTLAAVSPARAGAPWCASITGPEGGYVSCSYVSWQQCQAALSGLGGICYMNPAGGNSARRHG